MTKNTMQKQLEDNNSSVTPEQEFYAAIHAAGLNPPDEIIADGEIHRFSTVGAD